MKSKFFFLCCPVVSSCLIYNLTIFFRKLFSSLSDGFKAQSENIKNKLLFTKRFPKYNYKGNTNDDQVSLIIEDDEDLFKDKDSVPMEYSENVSEDFFTDVSMTNKDDSSSEDDSDSDEDELISDHEIYILLLMIQERHQLSNVAVSDIAQLLNILIGEKRFVTSFEAIKKYSKIFTTNVKKHFYLPESPCGITGVVEDLNLPTSCDASCGYCEIIIPQNSISIQGSASYFCSVELNDWLRYMIPLFYDKMSFNPDFQKKTKICDVKSADEYERLFNYGEMLNKQNNTNHKAITISLGFDGVVYTKDNSSSLWPIVAYINELPFDLRQKNGFVLSLHAGKKKPQKEIFKPLVDELLFYNHHPLTIDINGEQINFNIRLLSIIADAPARSDCLNIKQYNSE